MSQKWPPPKPSLAQEEFDESVRTSIEDFDMTPEEAINSAIEEFTVQGYDLSGVVKTAGGVDATNQPIATASAALSTAVDAGDIDGLAAPLAAIASALSAAGADPVELSQIALKSSALRPVLAAAKLCAASLPGSRAQLVSSLVVARDVMGLQAPEIKDAFIGELRGGDLLMGLIEGDAAADVGLMAEVAATAEVVMSRAEKNKQILFVSGFGTKCLQLLGSLTSGGPGAAPLEANDLALMRALCGALAALINSDDERASASNAFKNTLKLAKDGDGSQALIRSLRAAASDVPTYVAVLSCVTRFAANDEICKEFAVDGGCVDDMLVSLRANSGDRGVVRAVLATLRQLANSDTVKVLLAEHSGIQLLMGLCGAWDSADDVLEHALGVLASMMLRQPGIATQAAEAGADDLILEVMSTRMGSGPVLRQGCMALRNMAVRNPELRPQLLAKGAEERLRAAKAAHAMWLSDVASAGLRDLGLENYSDAPQKDPADKKPLNFRPDMECSEAWVIDRS